VVLARSGSVRLSGRDTRIVLAAVGRTSRLPRGLGTDASRRLRVVLKDVVARERVPPYDVFLAVEGASSRDAALSPVRIGALDLFGGAGRGGHEHGSPDHRTEGELIAFDATAALVQLARGRVFDLRRLRVSIRRRGFGNGAGGEYVPADPDPPQIKSVELIRS
jgi:hypothetical protein